LGRGRLRPACSTCDIGRLRRRRHAARRTRGRRRRRGLDCRLRLLLRGALSRSHAVREEQVEPEHAGEPDGDGDEQVLVLVLHARLFREDGGTGSAPPATPASRKRLLIRFLVTALPIFDDTVSPTRAPATAIPVEVGSRGRKLAASGPSAKLLPRCLIAT